MCTLSSNPLEQGLDQILYPPDALCPLGLLRCKHGRKFQFPGRLDPVLELGDGADLPGKGQLADNGRAFLEEPDAVRRSKRK